MTHATAKLEPQHPPLARDSVGNLVAVPDGTAAWRICRETAGRPREIRGPDKQPVRFPLAMTTEELADLCGLGVYRVYALDEVGEQLSDDQTAKWDLSAGPRELRNASDASVLAALRPGGNAAASDLRFALEAITQMMRTNTDALRIVTESHVDLAKTITNAKGLRNAALYTVANTESDQDEEEDDEGEPQNLVGLLMPLAQKLAEVVPGLVMGKVMGTGATTHKALNAESTSADDDLANRPAWEARDLIDLAYAKRKGDAKRAAKQGSNVDAGNLALQAHVLADPALAQQLIAIRTQLSTDDIETLMNSAARMPEQQQLKLLDSIKALPLDEAVTFCCEIVEEIRRHQSVKENA